MKRKPKPEKPVPVDPGAPVFVVGDKVEVLSRPLWTGYVGYVNKVEGGICRCRLLISPDDDQMFHADIPAAELKKL